MDRRNGQPMEPCVYHEELSQDIKSLKEDVAKIREWMVADELKQSFSEADMTKVTEELNRLVCELKKTRQDFSKEIYELKLVLSKEYTVKEDLGSFATDIGNTLEKLNKKIDEGYAVLEKKIDVGDQKIKDGMKGTFWKIVMASIAFGGFLVSVIVAILNFFGMVF